jgi:hypothetical protein
MVKKTTNNTPEGNVDRHADELLKAVEADPGYELYSRIRRDIEALAAASDVEMADGQPPLARFHWWMLAGELAEAGILDRLNAEVTMEGKHSSTDQLTSDVSLGAAMHLFFEGANDHDFLLKNKLEDAIMAATENLDRRFTGRHWGMAVTDLARIAYLAETTEDAS